jgi:polysaccharide export outer membrane protein
MGCVRVSKRLVASICLVATLAACAGLPASGPSGHRISSGAVASLPAREAAAKYGYALVDLSPVVLAFAGERSAPSLLNSFGAGHRPAPRIHVGVGDVVQVTVFESQAGGLFIPKEAASRPGNYVTFPAQTVSRDGTINVPYAGKIAAAGHTLGQIEHEIVTHLSNRAIEPQAIVTLVNQRATDVSVVGEVNAPNVFPIDPGGDRVLDILAKAGGIKDQGYDTYVTLQRHHRESTIYFPTLVRHPRENIFVDPGDTLYVFMQPRTFQAYGASGQNGLFNFGQERLSFAEGVAKAGGLLDNRAEPSEVYLYRQESRGALQKMGINLSQFDPRLTTIPTVFRANFRTPSSFFLAQKFAMQDKDIIYVSNSASTELMKFLSVIEAISAPAANFSAAAANTSSATTR